MWVAGQTRRAASRVGVVRGVTLADVLRSRDNDYTPIAREYEMREGRRWAEPVAAATMASPVSVVVPAFEAAATLGHVLDALALVQNIALDVVVVDDASHDRTSRVAAQHWSAPTVLRLPKRVGPGDARNVGVALAASETVLFVDADMMVSTAAVAEHAVRASDGLVCVSGPVSRPARPVMGEWYAVKAVLPEEAANGRPDPAKDPRVYWRGDRGLHPYSGLLRDTVRVPLLDRANDLLGLGHGRWEFDFDLPRMVDAKLLSVGRGAFIDVGGFDPEFAAGWGHEDTFLGAKLIAAGSKVAPLRHSVGFHLVVPNANPHAQGRRAAEFQDRNRAKYWDLIGGPVPRRDRGWFTRHTNRLIREGDLMA